jgi:hypothetical protein
MAQRKIVIDEALIDIVRNLVTDNEAEVESVALALTLLLDPVHMRRETAMRAAIVVSGEIGQQYPEVFHANDLRAYFVQMLGLISEGVSEYFEGLPSAGDA